MLHWTHPVTQSQLRKMLDFETQSTLVNLSEHSLVTRAPLSTTTLTMTQLPYFKRQSRTRHVMTRFSGGIILACSASCMHTQPFLADHHTLTK